MYAESGQTHNAGSINYKEQLINIKKKCDNIK